MQPVSRLAPARPPHGRVGTAALATTTSRSRGCAWRVGVVVPAPRPCQRARASCGGGATEPVEARKGVEQAEAGTGTMTAEELEVPRKGVEQAEAGTGTMAAEELEVLEEEAIVGDDEGRRPTDYDRRAHIFEESSRVFQELKHRRDGGSEGGHGGVADAATGADETVGTREQRQQQPG